MSETKIQTDNTHLLLYPFPTSGHVIPLLDLTDRLLTRGLSITLLVTPSNRPLLDPLLAAHPSSLHPFLLPSPSPASSPNRLVAIMRAMRDAHSPLIIQWFRSHPSPPVAIVSDFFLGWTHHLACHVGIKRLVFSPSGAFAQSLSNHLWRDLPQVRDPDDVDAPISFPAIPGRPIYPWWQVSYHYRNYNEDDPDSNFLRENFLANLASWGVVFNSFAELERVYLDHTKNELGHDRVWAVGPLLPPLDDSVGPSQRGGGPTVPAQDLMTWLDARADGTVIYVCFGSRAVLTRAQMEPLAEALERSGVHFVWCARAPDERHVAMRDVGEIPDGFEDRTAGRGFVVRGWAPQVAVLRHRAVGAFLSHCGWNSVLEGLSSGTMMLTWPMGADQFTNAKLLVDQLGVGVRVGEETRKIPDSAELARLLSECVEGDGRRLEKIRVKEISDVARSGVQGDKELDDLVNKLSELKNTKD